MALTAAEQYLLELINRARLDPQAEADRYGVSLNSGLASGTIDGGSKQVLAHNAQLELAAQRHGNWMLSADTFSHTGSGGSNPGQRMESAGYDFSGNWTWRENLAWTGSTGSISLSRAIEQHHEGLYRSSGHRANTFAEDIREIGVAQVSGKFTYQGSTYNASMLTEKFAKSGSDVFVTGVYYVDSDKDDFYSIGEGRGNMWVRADGGYDKTESAGGYAVAVDADDATAVRVGYGSSTYATLTLDTSDGNAKLDMVKLGAGQWELHVSGSADLGSGIADARLLGVENLDLRGSGANNDLWGNSGGNKMFGYAGNDRIYGDDGADRMAGGHGNDRLVGGGHGDRIWGQDGADWIYGGWGSDSLFGGAHSDRIFGQSGNDKLYGGAGSDALAGGSGADEFHFNHGDDVIYDFEDNIDTIVIDRALVDANTTVSQIIADAREVGGNVILDFDGGHSLTLRGVADADILANDLTIL